MCVFSLTRLAVLSAIVALPLAGCGSVQKQHGQVLNPMLVERVQVGQTTKPQVQRLLGSPSVQDTFNPNRWIYISSSAIDKPLNPNILQDREVLVIDFDDSGIVANIATRTEADGKTLEPDVAQTPTHGQSLGILDQLMGNLGMGL